MYSGAKQIRRHVFGSEGWELWQKIRRKKVCDNPESALIYDVTNLNIFERKKYDLAAVWVQRQVAGGFLMRWSINFCSFVTARCLTLTINIPHCYNAQRHNAVCHIALTVHEQKNGVWMFGVGHWYLVQCMVRCMAWHGTVYSVVYGMVRYMAWQGRVRCMVLYWQRLLILLTRRKVLAWIQGGDQRKMREEKEQRKKIFLNVFINILHVFWWILWKSMVI